MFGISYESWKEICDMYFSLHTGTQKAYLQWFPFSKLSEEDKAEISEEDFYNKYIQTGGFVLFPEVMRHSENYIQKSDGSFCNAALISPMLFLVLQAIGKEIASRYTQQRPVDIGVYYAGNYEFMRPKYIWQAKTRTARSRTIRPTIRREASKLYSGALLIAMPL